MGTTRTITLTQALELALRHQQSGNLAQAETIYHQVLLHDPGNTDAYHLLGVIAYQRRNYTLAEKNIRQAIGLHCTIAPYYNSLGLVQQELGRFAEAIATFQTALQVEPQMVESQSNLGNVLRLQGKLDDARAAYQQALKIHPRFADAQCGLGKVYVLQGKVKEAKHCFDITLALNPQSADAHNGLGLLLEAEKRYVEAEREFRQALTLSPDFAEAHNNLGTSLALLGKQEEASDCFKRALALNPQLTDTHINLGNALKEQGRLSEATKELDQALQQAPNSSRASESLATVLQESGRTDEALSQYQHTLAINPKDGIRIKIATLLPVIPSSTDQMMAWRRRFETGVSQLLDAQLLLGNPIDEVNKTNFYLSYHGLPNRDIQENIARMYEKACPSLLWSAPHCGTWTAPSGRIRIGFISRFMHNHSIGKTTRGLLANLSKDKFETYALFAPPKKVDQISSFIRENCDQFVELPYSIDAARTSIAELKLDVLFYQDIGMEPYTYFLAFSRLAPVQCVSFGHPDTTGIRNMDYWVSNDLFEPDEADAHYSEKLFLLHNLGTLAYYYRPKLPERLKARDAFGLPEDARLYLCPQALFKFHPDFDAILGGILRADPKGKVVLIESKAERWVKLQMARFRNSMPDVCERVIFVPRQKGLDFLNLLAVSDVMLDTIHFNGMNSSLEGFAAGTPIVTMPTEFQRGRHTSGMYRKMGMDECIARTPEEYINIAVRLGCDPEFRRHVKQRIAEHSNVLYEDMNVVREFERFFVTAVGSHKSN